MAASIRVEVVCATGVVWEGDATLVVARTTEGDIGIMAGHEPLLAALAPCATQIEKAGGGREIVLVDGGYISVAGDEVSVLSQYARMARDLDPDAVARELEEAAKQVAEDEDDQARRRYRRAEARMAAIRLLEQIGGLEHVDHRVEATVEHLAEGE